MDKKEGWSEVSNRQGGGDGGRRAFRVSQLIQTNICKQPHRAPPARQLEQTVVPVKVWLAPCNVAPSHHISHRMCRLLVQITPTDLTAAN